jgi:putative transposase
MLRSGSALNSAQRATASRDRRRSPRAASGIKVSYEIICEWSLRFGRTYAKTLKWRRPQPGDKWFLDEVFVRIRGKLHYLWRAVDQHGNVLDVLVQSRRSTKAAKRFFRASFASC